MPDNVVCKVRYILVVPLSNLRVANVRVTKKKMIFEIRCRNYFVLLIALWNCWIKVQFYFITFDNLKMFKWYHQLQEKMFCSGIINKSSLVTEKRLVYILVYWSTFPLIDWPRSGMWMVRNWRNGLGRPLQRGVYGPGVPIELIISY